MEMAKRRGLETLQEKLLLAVEDMEQANAAATALRADRSDDEAWRRALETAMAVAYMRPFTSGAWKLPARYEPKAGNEGVLHTRLRKLRNEVYAHSDRRSGRSADMSASLRTGNDVLIRYRTGWEAFPVEDLPAVQELVNNQRERFLAGAAAIHVELAEASS
jgi:hypothetical protein